MPAKIIIDAIKRGGRTGEFLLTVSRKLMERTARSRLDLFRSYVRGKKVLDVGMGAGAMAKLLQTEGCTVTSLDVTDTSLYPSLRAQLYDGIHMPQKSQSYDAGLLICVLHHCSEPMTVLAEVMRICKRVVIIEDTYRNKLEHYLISARDNVGNFEFYQHPYHTTDEWRNLFRKMGWRTVVVREWSSVEFYGMYGRQTLFVIEPKLLRP